jgi:hypothetical protein
VYFLEIGRYGEKASDSHTIRYRDSLTIFSTFGFFIKTIPSKPLIRVFEPFGILHRILHRVRRFRIIFFRFEAKRELFCFVFKRK